MFQRPSFLYLIYVPFLHPSMLSRAIHRTYFSRLAGAQFADHITCLAPAILFQFEHTLRQLNRFTHTHTCTLILQFEYV